MNFSKGVQLTGSTYRDHSDTMCAYCVGSNASFRCPSSHGSAQNAFHSDDAKAKTISSSPELNPFQAIPPSTATAPRFPFDPDTHITSTHPTYRGSINPANIVQPPDDVIDYWFHRLGLSLGTPALGTLSDMPNLSPTVSPLDDINLEVSAMLVILRHVRWYSRLAYTVKRNP